MTNWDNLLDNPYKGADSRGITDMICPSCGSDVELACRLTPAQAAKMLGSKGGKAKGARKARPREHYVAAAKKRWAVKPLTS